MLARPSGAARLQPGLQGTATSESSLRSSLPRQGLRAFVRKEWTAGKYRFNEKSHAHPPELTPDLRASSCTRPGHGGASLHCSRELHLIDDLADAPKEVEFQRRSPDSTTPRGNRPQVGVRRPLFGCRPAMRETSLVTER